MQPANSPLQGAGNAGVRQLGSHTFAASCSARRSHRLDSACNACEDFSCLTWHDGRRAALRHRTAAPRQAGSWWRPAVQTFPGLRAEVRLLREVAGLSQPLASHPPSSSRHTGRLAHEMMSRWVAASIWSPVARRRGRAKARSVVVAVGRSGCSDAVCRRTHPPIGAAVQAAPGAGSCRSAYRGAS